MDITVRLDAVSPDATGSTFLIDWSYFVGDGDFYNTGESSISKSTASLMNTAVVNICIADAASNGYTVGLLDAKYLTCGFNGL